MFKKMSLLVLGITLFACGAGAKWPEADRQKLLAGCGGTGQPPKAYCECALSKSEAAFASPADAEKATTEAKTKLAADILTACGASLVSPAPTPSK